MNTKLGLLTTVTGAMLAFPVAAQENINLTVISGNGPQTAYVSAITEAFIPKVDAILAQNGNYKISWNEAYSGQIAKPRAELEAVQSGLGDIGAVVTAYTPDKLPMHQLAFAAPFSSQDPRAQTGAMNQLLQTRESYQNEWDQFNQVALQISAMVDEYTIFSSVPIESLADLKGKKIAGVGANLAWVQAVGAATVTGEMATAYNSLQTGVYEGGFYWQQLAVALKLCDPAPYALETGAGGSPSVAITVNKDVWTELPSEVKAALQDGGADWHEANMKALADGSATGRKVCEEQYGQMTSTLSEEDMKAWAAELPNLGSEWAERAEANGAPGREVLTEYMTYLRDSGQTVFRDWDKE